MKRPFSFMFVVVPVTSGVINSWVFHGWITPFVMAAFVYPAYWAIRRGYKIEMTLQLAASGPFCFALSKTSTLANVGLAALQLFAALVCFAVAERFSRLDGLKD